MKRYNPQYYLDEIQQWETAVDGHLTAISGLKYRLEGLIRKNTIPGLAKNSERFLHVFERIGNVFVAVLHAMNQQAASIRKGELPDESLSDEQEKLRDQMHRAESRFIEEKYACLQFLSETME